MVEDSIKKRLGGEGGPVKESDKAMQAMIDKAIAGKFEEAKKGGKTEAQLKV